MRLGRLHGTIDRRLLVNFHVDPQVVAKLLPDRFRPQTVEGRAIVGICLIRFSSLRPYGLPGWMGFDSENAAHRIAVEWDSEDGTQSGVFVHRRDTSLWVNTLIGGRLFPGVHYRADFDVQESANDYRVAFRSRQDGTSVRVEGSPSGQFPEHSIFRSLDQSSEFFRLGSVGFSPGFRSDEYQGLQLVTERWKAEPFHARKVHSTYFADESLFPRGSLEFDHALIMCNLPHSWRVVR